MGEALLFGEGSLELYALAQKLESILCFTSGGRQRVSSHFAFVMVWIC